MEELIKQAFLHVDVIGPHVMEGHYDLIGPDGEIILPQVWEALIEPGWSISMLMWPLPEQPANSAVPSSADSTRAHTSNRPLPLFQGTMAEPPLPKPVTLEHHPFIVTPTEAPTTSSGKRKKLFKRKVR